MYLDLLGHAFLQASHLHWYGNSQFLERKSSEEEVLGLVSPLLQKEHPVEPDLLPDSLMTWCLASS